MVTTAHHGYNNSEALEIKSFSRSEWVRFEKRDDASPQIVQAPDAETPHVLAVIVVPMINRHYTAPEELSECTKYRNTSFSLNNREIRLDLPT